MKLYKITEVAKELGLHPQTLRWYEREGKITPPKRTPGKTRVWTKEDIEELKKEVFQRR